MSARVISSSLETSLASLIICFSVKGLVRPSWVIASIAVDVAHPEAEAGAGQQVGRLAHRLHAAGDGDLGVAGADRLVGDAERAHARGADLVDRLRGDLLRDAALDLGLARGDLALAGLQDLAEDDLLDLLGVDAGALERRLDRVCRRGRWRRARRGAPPILPKGVRAVPRMTVLGICCLSVCGFVGSRLERAAWPDRDDSDRAGCRACREAHRLAPDEGRGPPDASSPRSSAELRRRRPLRGRGAARPRSPTARGRRRRQGRLQEARRCSTPSGPRGCWSSASASARRLDAERAAGRRGAGRQGGRPARGATRSPGRCRRPTTTTAIAPKRWSPARSSAPTASTASRAPTPTTRRRRALESLTLLAPAGVAGGGRGGPRLRRGAEPRPRPAEPPRQRRHALLPGRPGRGDRRRPRARSRSRCSAASRSPPRGWAASVAVSQGSARGAEADRPALRGRRRRPDPGPGRQGRHLRHRRHLAQARRRRCTR